jgi:prepilin-type N-terminal cleavage/methylation domain-containing protein
MTRPGFTIIELLVVVTIIVVLLALLTPALDKAIESAERAKCAANLDAWGIAHHTYYVEQRRRILSTMRTSSQYPNPNFCWANADRGVNSAGTAAQDFAARPLVGYVPGTDPATGTIRGIWHCPSNRAPLKEERSRAAFSATTLSGYFQPDYAYFAHAEIWGRDHATRPEYLTGARPAPGKLLMADVVWQWRVNKTWWYNHGEQGYSVHDVAWGGPVLPAPPLITGTNRLLGDGSVSWKDGKEFDRTKMVQIDRSIPWVSHQGSNGEPDSTGDINYY